MFVQILFTDKNVVFIFDEEIIALENIFVLIVLAEKTPVERVFAFKELIEAVAADILVIAALLIFAV